MEKEKLKITIQGSGYKDQVSDDLDCDIPEEIDDVSP